MLGYSNVERYDSYKDIWESLKSLSWPRLCHSSCTIGNTMYVLGGFNMFRRAINSIEKLPNIDELDEGVFSSWKLIETTEDFLPRFFPVFCAWNKQEMVILGGKT